MKRRLLAIMVALALAVVGCLAVVMYVKRADERALAGREAVWVLLVKDRVPAGTTGAQLREGDLVERVAMPAATVPEGVIDQIDDQLAALTVTADVQASQLLLRGMFGESTRVSGGLALPDGKVAVSLPMNAAGRVAGYVRPGAKIAIYDTFTIRAGKGRIPTGSKLALSERSNHATRVLLPRIEVIAVGERGTAGAATSNPDGPENEEKAGKGGGNVLVTMAATQWEAERLIHASLTGTLTFVLLDDTATIQPNLGVDNNSLFP